MSYQLPIESPPIINSTQPSTSANVSSTSINFTTTLINLLRDPINLLIIVAIIITIVFVLAFIFLRHRGIEGSTLRVRKRGDVLGVLIDVNSNELVIVPMKRVGPYRYTFRLRGIDCMFIPVDGRQYIFRDVNMPAFLGIMAGRLGFEFNPTLLFSTGIAKVVAKDITSDLESDSPKALEKLLLTKLAGQESVQQGELPSLTGIAFQISIPKLIEAIYRDRIMKAQASLNALTEAWESIEELAKASHRSVSPSEIGRLIIYASISIIIIVVAIFLMKIFNIM